MAYKKVDNNQKEIVRALRNVGAGVQSLASVGKGCPDLLVLYRGKWFVMEVKTEFGKLRPAQIRWIKTFRDEVVIPRNAEDALRVIGALK